MIAARWSSLAVNTKADALTALLNGGFLDLYAGRRPATLEGDPADAPLARLQFADPAFVRAVNGVSVAYPLHAELAAPLAGTATWFRCLTAEDEPMLDGSVGTSHADLVLSSTTILVGTRVTIDRFELHEDPWLIPK